MTKLLQFDDFTLDTARSRLLGPGGEIALRPKSFDVIRHLLEQAGRVVGKDELMQAVWPGVAVSDESLAQCISEVRRALGKGGPRIVRTVPRRGYVIDVPVTPAASATAAGEAEAVNPAAPESRPSIAVLPLEAVGGDADADLARFTDGLTEDVITGLSRIRALWVIASSTMFTYKARAIDVPTVGRELQVNYVVSGRIRKADDRLRLTVQLTETSTGHQLWAATFDRRGGGSFELQDDLSRCVIASVQVQLIVSGGRVASRPAAPVGNLARSWERLYRATAAGLSEAIAGAERALEADQANGEACRLLAAATWHQAYRGHIPWDQAAAERVMTFAQRAVVAEDADEYSHWVLGLAHLMARQHERAVVSLQRALDINPSFSLAYGTLGTVLAWGGKPDESIANNQLALRINPGDPLNPHRYFGLALAQYLASHHAPAIENAALAVQLLPEWWLGLMVYAASLAQTGRLAEARAVCADLRRVMPDTTVASLDRLPFARAADCDRLGDGLRKAGLPD
ncbi:winged helix-turn-helix domain-containing protein [Reyranella sp.]|uniref:winged helix-turn-helix domain-containing protein n=1 Tax=Reyranella sp. TaxID=1929291 RepID=UPI003BAA3BEB